MERTPVQNALEGRGKWPEPGSIRRAALATGGMTLMALTVMALLAAVGLSRADTLLERLRWSQDQLGQVLRIQAQVDRLRADVATGTPLAGGQVDQVERSLRDYSRSVREEGRLLDLEDLWAQEAEAEAAAQMAAMFQAWRREGGLSDPGATARFDTLAASMIAKEHEESQEARLAVADLKRTVTTLAVVIPILVGLLGAAGLTLIFARVAGPLQALETTVLNLGQDKGAPQVGGFTEFRRLAAAFGRMNDQIAAQRATLQAINTDLERQVLERTAEIEAGREALAEIDRNRRLFFSKLGHELRTPATIIRGEAEVALRDPDASAARLREALAEVAANSQFLQRRLEDMLALARAEDGRVVLSRAPVDLSEVMRQAVAMAEPYVRASGLEVAARIEDDAGPGIEGDASWLLQAVLALVDNAAKFAAGAEPIRLGLSREGSDLVIAVADDGPGVDPVDLPRLFEDYYQTAAGRARGGSGLGLSIARWVAEQHGGRIRAIPGAPSGLAVEIALPVRV